jgi:hypothetical protein
LFALERESTVVAVLVDVDRYREFERSAAPEPVRRYPGLQLVPDLEPAAPASRPGVGRTADARSVRAVPAPSRHVYLRRRVLAVGLLAAMAVVGFIALQAAVGRAGGGPLTATGSARGLQPTASRVWVVQPGDTLWTIARAVGVKGDIRPFVDRLSAEVGGKPLQVGERIALP